MRRSLALFSAGVICAVAVPALAQQGMMRFRDVTTADFYAEDLDVLADQGILKGYDDGRFGPNDTVTRGQIAAILRRYDATNVQPMRDQLYAIRQRFDLGACGDGDIQIGEDCDDGNTRNGDGCTEYCLEEDTALCSGGHRPGESYPSPDGCNSCTCTANGEICTLRYCAPEPSCDPYVCADGTKVDHCAADGTVINYFAAPCMTHGGEVTADKCLSDNDCRGGTVCSTRYGDCESACEPGAEACITACAGHCTEPRDEVSCDAQKEDFDALAANSASCTRDSDCVIFEASCPYVTCGVAVNAAAKSRLQSSADAYVSCLEDNDQPVACADCMGMTPRCVNKRCMADMR